ncbi:aminotransferase class V-fold PLP-dependent enzyme [Arundinibacter roseus]|uniref:Alanine--glyoxylate aminotransferase family protein n=1 Tax=Arundinibacter roseus TaxID=2070510 RepID=A0A4R4KEV9_9BACT|nr:aminotransferase class V-fold PLP-dependent enzyme [Arundinibacter roseus]TDB65081.1 alanine--glyoxylate aminotransferase family protein [Arundinibacter roseus]
MNLTFYPGPSKLHAQVEQHLQEAFQSGLLSANHRSTAFMAMLEETLLALRIKLSIPDGYEVYLTSSATECWEIISQSLVQQASHHVYNGAFGKKWFEYAQRLHPATTGQLFGFNDFPPDPAHVPAAEVLCVTHTETSNGTALPLPFLAELRKNQPGLIAVDATSSMGGEALPWLLADVWFASVQKCFGLPSGLGILIVSPLAIERAQALNEQNHYNSLLFIRSNFQQFQTPFTPNTLGIFLLKRCMQERSPIEKISTSLHQRAEIWYNFLRENGYKLLVGLPEVQAVTVVVAQDSEENIRMIKAKAQAAEITLGNGYGAWKKTTFRLANFPAITTDDSDRLMQVLQRSDKITG